MKKIILIKNLLIVLTFISCGKKLEPIKSHHPQDDLNQEIVDDYAQELFDKAYDEYDDGEFESAKSKLNKAILIEKNTVLYNKLGTIQLAEKEYSKAIRTFQKGRKIDDKYWPNYINEARALLALEKYVDAEKILKLLQSDTDSEYWVAYANFYLAIRYFNDENQCALALDFLEKSETLKSDNDLNEIYTKIENQLRNYCGQQRI